MYPPSQHLSFPFSLISDTRTTLSQLSVNRKQKININKPTAQQTIVHLSLLCIKQVLSLSTSHFGEIFERNFLELSSKY